MEDFLSPHSAFERHICEKFANYRNLSIIITRWYKLNMWFWNYTVIIMYVIMQSFHLHGYLHNMRSSIIVSEPLYNNNIAKAADTFPSMQVCIMIINDTLMARIDTERWK